MDNLALLPGRRTLPIAKQWHYSLTVRMTDSDPQHGATIPRNRCGRRSVIGLALGCLAFLALLLAPPPTGMPEAAWRVVAVGALMALWWVSEALPLAVTALLPLLLFPLLGIADSQAAASPYADPVIFLFLGGYLRRTHGTEIGFAQWMIVGVPLAVLLLGTWIILTRVAFQVPAEEPPDLRQRLEEEMRALGPLHRAEILVGTVFCAATLAWMLRPLLNGAISGLDDTVIAIGAALALFIIPSGRGGPLMTWDAAAQLPWCVLLILAVWLSPWFALLSGFVGAGLVFAGVTGFCGMARLLARLPWDRRAAGAA